MEIEIVSTDSDKPICWPFRSAKLVMSGLTMRL